MPDKGFLIPDCMRFICHLTIQPVVRSIVVQRIRDHRVPVLRNLPWSNRTYTSGKNQSAVLVLIIIALTSVFNIADEEIYDVFINQFDVLAHICDIYG